VSPTVSINLCCYNSEPFLDETLRSIVAQTYKDWELVVIDDGSTDSTGSIIREYISRGYPIVYHRQENHGLGYSRNEAIKRSSGQYIAFIDHDDLWLPGKLEKQVPLFNDLEVDLVYGNFYEINEDGSQRQIGRSGPQPRGHVFKRFLKHYPVNLQTVMVRKSSLERLGSLFDPALQMSEEYDLFMRLLYHGKADYLEMPVAEYRIHEAMASLRKIDQYPVEYKYILEKLGRQIPDFEDEYQDELRYLRAKIGYWHASAEMLKGSRRTARNYLAPFRWHGPVFLALYCLTFLPRGLWLRLQGNRGRFRSWLNS
jgi:glycosyltransferase involved in cell wall biosynthesis